MPGCEAQATASEMVHLGGRQGWHHSANRAVRLVQLVWPTLSCIPGHRSLRTTFPSTANHTRQGGGVINQDEETRDAVASEGQSFSHSIMW